MAKSWWHRGVEETARELGADGAAGLSAREAAARLEKFGRNQLQEAPKRSPLSIFLDQFKDFIIWVLIAAAIISGVLQEVVDAIAIVAIVILNAILGFVQEYRAEKSLAALKKLSSPTSKVIREGQHSLLPSEELVPGDLVELEAGDSVPADGRVAWVTSNFTVQEASLTGESTPVAKTTVALDDPDVPLADRANMIYLGTSVASGRARAIVTETGMQTELGRIAGMIQEIERESTPLQQKLEQFGKWIVYMCFVLVAVVFALQLSRGGRVIDVFLTAVSLAVAAIPEGLPAVVTIALALGVQRMVKRHALIRRLRSVETLGSATVICSDKTGTLTKNEMTVQAIFAGGQLFRVTGIGYAPKGEFLANDQKVNPQHCPDLMKALTIGVLCNGAQLVQERDSYKIVGDPTEAALLTVAGKADIWKDSQEQKSPFVDELPFDSQRKMMTVVRQADDGRRKTEDRGQNTEGGAVLRPPSSVLQGPYVAYVKGAPDVLLADCVNVAWASRPCGQGQDGPATTDETVRALTAEDRKQIAAANDNLTAQAMRVLGVGYRELEDAPGKLDAAAIERDLTFVGLIAMIDPPREEVKQAIRECLTAGIKTVMITGDHKNTATAIARQLGFFQEDSLALSGEELDKLSQEQLEQQVHQIPVYARVAPEHKLRVVRAWRSRHEIVAMTGDGVNDAPAVKEADIGVAMGITGTDVTKEVSDMVVTDDNFASIVAAVEEGRGIYDNILKFVHYLLSCNTGEILVMFVGSLIGLPVPLLPIQILWINLVTDGLPALALGVDPADPKIMTRRPRAPDEPVVTLRRGLLMLAQGIFIAACSLGAYTFVLFGENEGLARARTAGFFVLAVSQLFHAYDCRSQTESLFKLGFFTNRSLVLATGLSFVLQMAVVYVPGLQTIFKTEPLGPFDWVLVVVISSLPLWGTEIYKAIRRHLSPEQES